MISNSDAMFDFILSCSSANSPEKAIKITWVFQDIKTTTKMAWQDTTGFVQIFGSKILDFFQTFFQINNFFVQTQGYQINR